MYISFGRISILEIIHNCHIAGMVILYNPDRNVIENIRSYIEDIDHLYVIDNSEMPFFDLTILSHKVTYVANNCNSGVASALNKGASLAIAYGYKWLLTMDQDSRATESMITTMRACLNSMDSEKIGIIAPSHNVSYCKKNIKDRLVVMTSGNLLNLRAFQICGDFEDKLFIDHVDHEYCLRLRKNGYKVVVCNEAKLNHRLGNSFNVRVFSFSKEVIQHNPLRWYYFLRNGVFVCARYFFNFPKFSWYFAHLFFKEIIKIAFLFDNKLQYLAMTARAIMDAFRGNFGKYHGK